MRRRTDCLYCGNDTGSKEHTFPAALGGRRINKGILCGPCNEKFSGLDALLSRQLHVINGLIGVRPDRADEPRPARINAVDGALTIDHAGKPVFAEPRVVSEESLDDGRRKVTISFSNEKQGQDWVSQQRAAGVRVERNARHEGQRFFTEDITVDFSFGGEDAFREIGRIALNFLAYRWPDTARMPALKVFKDWVEGGSELRNDDPRFVWYAPVDSFSIAESPFTFGHQILLVVGPKGLFGRVRFFSTFDLFVWFGAPSGVAPDAVIFDIDPLAESAPNDLRETPLSRTHFPETLTRPAAEKTDLTALMHSRFDVLFRRVEDRQWSIGTQGLLDSLNATRVLEKAERIDRVAELLAHHRGRVLLLMRHVVQEERETALKADVPVAAAMMDASVAGDASSGDGLTQRARAALDLAVGSLANAIANQLGTAPLTDDGLRAFLTGGPGLYAVGSTLWQVVSDELRKLATHSSETPDED
jgi:hypothetical protein